MSIMVKELCPLICACAVWGASWQGQSVLCECDILVSALWQRKLLPQQQSLMGQVDTATRISVGNVG